MRPNWENECVNKSALIEWLRPYLHTGEPIPADVLMSDIQMMPPTLTPQNEWVSVENALPSNMDDVLVVVQNNGECWTATGYYSNTSNVWYATLNGQDTQMDVLWWMPFPAPPDRRPPERQEDKT